MDHLPGSDAEIQNKTGENSPETDRENFDQHGFEIPPPEDFLPTPRKLGPFQVWPLRNKMFSAFMIMLICVFMTLMDVYFWDKKYFSVSGRTVFEKHQYWRLFSSLFVHADFSHLGFNAIPFLFFGWFLNAYFGGLFFPFISFIIGILSNLCTIYFYPPDTSLIGISGMVYGMISMWLVFYIRFDKDNKFTQKFIRVVGFVLMLLFPQAYSPEVSDLAHFSGFIFGIIFGFASLPWVKLRVDSREFQQPLSRYRYYSRFRIRKN